MKERLQIDPFKLPVGKEVKTIIEEREAKRIQQEVQKELKVRIKYG